MNVRFLAAVPVPVSFSGNKDKEDDDGQHDNYAGFSVDFDPDELESTNYRMLHSSVGLQTCSFILPQEQPIQLLFLRAIFTRLREDTNTPQEMAMPGEQLPFEAFQHAFERLFFLLSDPVPFDAYKDYDQNGDGYVAWEEFYRVYKRRKITVKLSVCERIFLTFDSSELAESSHLSHIVSVVLLLAILLSSCCFILSTHSFFQVHTGDPPYEVAPSAAPVFAKIDLACLMMFVVEYVLRLATCFNVRHELFNKHELLELVTGYDPLNLPSPAWRMVRFIFAPSNLVDFAAIMPAVLSLFVETNGGGFVVLRLIRLTRIFRVFRTPALTEPVVVLQRTMKRSTKALYILVFNLLLGIVIFGSLMFLAEGQGKWDPTTRTYLRSVGKNWNAATNAMEDHYETTPFESIPHTFWWAMVTATTVGYGDHSPTTPTGYVVAVLTMLFSLVILALPVGVIGGTFSQVWDEYSVEKKQEAANLRKHSNIITNAMTRLDPFKMCNMMLIEIWHEQEGSVDGKPSPAHFLGEAKINLELEVDTPVVKHVVVPLQDNNDIVPRKVSGQATLRYEWTPSPREIAEQADVANACATGGSGEASRPSVLSAVAAAGFEMHGLLKVTITSADSLLNLGSTRRNGSCNPYCTVLVYPSSPKANRKLQPCVWRTPAISNTLSPKWAASHCFEYNWSSTSLAKRSSIRADLVSRPPGDSENKKQGATLDEALSAIRELGSQLRQLREEVHNLSSRVDQLSAAGTCAAVAPEALITLDHLEVASSGNTNCDGASPGSPPNSAAPPD